MKKAYIKDILRSLRGNAKRLLAIMIITALGVGVFTGISAACEDMYLSADRFYDEQNLFDIQVQSTYGLTADDLTALSRVDGIELADGVFSKNVTVAVGGEDRTATLTTLDKKEINKPYIEKGRLPKKSGEIAVTRKYSEAADKHIGDTLTVSESTASTDANQSASDTDAASAGSDTEAKDSSDTDGTTDTDGIADTDAADTDEGGTLRTTTFTITGIVLDPQDTDNQDSPTAFRSSGASDYAFFILPADIDSGIYTSVYLTLDGARALPCYSDAYEDKVESMVKKIEGTIKDQREQARYDDILADAKGEISSQEDKANETLDEAQDKLDTARGQIEDGKKQLADAKQELADQEAAANEEFASARDEIASGRAQLADQEATLTEGEQSLADGQAELDAAAAELTQKKSETLETLDATEKDLTDKQESLNQAKTAQASALSGYQAQFGEHWPGDAWQTLVSAAANQTGQALANNPDAEPDSAAIAAATTDEQQALAGALTTALTALAAPSAGNPASAGSSPDDSASANSSSGDPASANSSSDDPASADSSPAGSSPADSAPAESSLAAPALDANTLIPQIIESGIATGITDASLSAVTSGIETFNTSKAEATTQLADAEAEIERGRESLAEKAQELADGRTQLEAAKAELDTNEQTLNEKEADTKDQLAAAKAELADKEKELAENEAKLNDEESTFKEKKQEADDEITDAYAHLDDIDMTQWYVFDRSSIGSYSGLDSDVDSINNIGKLFPFIFVLVAVLISLTTMTRMVEADRGLIGTYKGLGYSDAAISMKYLFFAVLTSLLGCILGLVVGFILLPKFLLWILGQMYALPKLYLFYRSMSAVIGCVIFIVGIIGATYLGLYKELLETPASLMRPRAPKSGSRILLERLTPVWKRLKFLNKVTARNLFRYKKRLLMTLAGIMGCTALVVSGYCIKDSVSYLRDGQYKNVVKYDVMAVADSDDNDQLTGLFQRDEIKESLNVQISNVKLFEKDGSSESVQLMVLPDKADLSPYINTANLRGKKATLTNDGVLLTQNAAVILSIDKGEEITVQEMNLDQGKVKVNDIVENYLGNTVYMTQSLYEKLYDTYAPNAVLANFSGSVKDPDAYGQTLLNQTYIRSSVNVAHTIANFSSDFAIVNSVVYVLILFAALLAFTVLFTLCATNISERIRELGTLKVLGFYDNEVHAYINKETLILTLIGVLLGLPGGYLLGSFIIHTLKMPSIHFVVSIRPLSYLLSAVISFSFAVIVSLMTYRAIDRVDMVESLKSVE